MASRTDKQFTETNRRHGIASQNGRAVFDMQRPHGSSTWPSWALLRVREISRVQRGWQGIRAVEWLIEDAADGGKKASPMMSARSRAAPELRRCCRQT